MSIFKQNFALIDCYLTGNPETTTEALYKK